jgi:hypothetical protein
MQLRLRERPESIRETPGAIRDARTEGSTGLDWMRNLAIAAAAGTFLALSGAMETSAAPMGLRLLYWIPLLIAGAFVGHAMSRLISRAPKASQNKWVFGAILAIGISIPITFIVWAYSNWLLHTGMGADALPYLFGSVLLISAAMTAIMVGANWPGRFTHRAPETATAVRFLNRLPAKLKGAVLYAVSAEDHYLRLHTSKGTDLILMRLSDAISELEGVEGAQTHRSWWVARDAVESGRREGDRAILVLKGGAEAPVSRQNVRPLREASWF